MRDASDRLTIILFCSTALTSIVYRGVCCFGVYAVKHFVSSSSTFAVELGSPPAATDCPGQCCRACSAPTNLHVATASQARSLATGQAQAGCEPRGDTVTSHHNRVVAVPGQQHRTVGHSTRVHVPAGTVAVVVHTVPVVMVWPRRVATVIAIGAIVGPVATATTHLVCVTLAVVFIALLHRCHSRALRHGHGSGDDVGGVVAYSVVQLGGADHALKRVPAHTTCINVHVSIGTTYIAASAAHGVATATMAQLGCAGGCMECRRRTLATAGLPADLASHQSRPRSCQCLLGSSRTTGKDTVCG